jgi:hypothetical protein
MCDGVMIHQVAIAANAARPGARAALDDLEAAVRVMLAIIVGYTGQRRPQHRLARSMS